MNYANIMFTFYEMYAFLQNARVFLQNLSSHFVRIEKKQAMIG